MRSSLVLLAVALTFTAACAGDDVEAELRERLEGFFGATLNGDVAALEDYVSDMCPAKAAFIEQAGVLHVLEPVDVEVPEGAFLFDVEGDVAVAKRAREGLAVLIDGGPTGDDPANDVPVKLVLEEDVWRVASCDAYSGEYD